MSEDLPPMYPTVSKDSALNEAASVLREARTLIQTGHIAGAEALDRIADTWINIAREL